MAPADEYTAAAGAGKLKLKGVKDGRVEKKKKKKKEKKEGEVATADAEREASAGAEARGEEEDVDERGYRLVGKTEAEKRYEEAKRKRVCISLFFLFFCSLSCWILFHKILYFLVLLFYILVFVLPSTPFPVGPLSRPFQSCPHNALINNYLSTSSTYLCMHNTYIPTYKKKFKKDTS